MIALTAALPLAIAGGVAASAAMAARTIPAWPKAIEGSRRLVDSVLKGKEDLGKLTTAEREQAANYYEELSKHVVGTLADAATTFNLERARYLREGGAIPPGTLPQFINRILRRK
jgi:hypothetical protein